MFSMGVRYGKGPDFKWQYPHITTAAEMGRDCAATSEEQFRQKTSHL